MNPVVDRCPRCGRPSTMEKDEALSYCSTCRSVHEPGEQGITDVEIGKFGIAAEGERVYVPFWRFFCDFNLNARTAAHRNVSEFLKEGSSGRIFVYVPAAILDSHKALELGAYLTANSPSYATATSFGDVRRLQCSRNSRVARNEVSFYFLAAEDAESRAEDLSSGFSIQPTTEKLVFVPCYRNGQDLRPAV